MQTTSKPITNNSQADESNHSPLFWRGVGGEASWRWAGGEAHS